MKILIAADMEGISGVVNWDQVTPGHAEYARFRKIMTAEVNAAASGALEGGADEVIIADGHWDGLNILIEELDHRARLNSGGASPYSMLEGIQTGVDGVLFVGYHARAGSQAAILAHTWSDTRIANVWLNDILVGEYGLNAALAGYFEVPVLMVTGDQVVCAQTVELLGEMETVVVKQATSFATAECLPPTVTQQRIREAAARAVKSQGKKPRAAFRLAGPVKVTVELLHPDQAERAARLPGAQRLDGRRVEFTAADMAAAYLSFRAAVKMASA
jgi:D-amino peptidase